MSGPKRIGTKLPPTKSEVEAMQVAYEMLADGARGVGEQFTEPDEDWAPVWLLVNGEQGTVLSGGIDKHEMTRQVAALARRLGAVAIGNLMSSWTVAHGSMTPERRAEVDVFLHQRGGAVSELPERVEALTLATYTASQWAMHQALIHRHDDGPPTLDPFKLLVSSEQEGASFSGAMASPLQAALRRVG